MKPLINPIPQDSPTFCGFPRCDDVDSLEADMAVLGVANVHGRTVSYPESCDAQPGAAAGLSGPQAIRLHSLRYASSLRHYDFEFQGDLFAGRDVRVVDCGDVALTSGESGENLSKVQRVVERILERKSIPIILGDPEHVAPIPVLRAYEKHDPLYVIQVDAHLDYRDERGGIRDGGSSCTRRASEMPWVTGISQVGLQGVGSARREEYDLALQNGNRLITAREIHEQGVVTILKQIPSAANYYITIDADALDPSIAPGVYYPSPDGLGFTQITDLLKGIARRGRIVGLDYCAFVPELDLRNLTAIFAARLLLNLIGTLAYAGQIG